jgi:CheY-like chemotaxis protein
MTDTDLLKGKKILIVDDEPDVLDVLEELLDMCEIHRAGSFEDAKGLLESQAFDVAILDIMGVNGLKLLEETVQRGIPTVMLTAHAINPETLLASIRKGAISYLPKETLADLDKLLNELLEAYEKGEPPWKLLFDKLGSYFDERFGPSWKEKDREFWDDFSRTYQIGKGIQQRLLRDEKILQKGI